MAKPKGIKGLVVVFITIYINIKWDKKKTNYR